MTYNETSSARFIREFGRTTKPQPKTRRPLLTPGEVAELFRVDPKTVTRWAKDGKLRSVATPGGHRRFYPEQIAELLDVNVEEL